MNKITSIPLLLIFTVLTNTIGLYAGINGINSLNTNNHRQTKSYLNEALPAEAYCDVALKGELRGTETKKDPFLLSSLKQIGTKPSGVNKGGIYRDPNGDIWFVKEAQQPIHEYLGSKVMNLLVGPLSPEVTPIIDAPKYTASKLLPGFIMKMDVLKDSNHKPITGELKLSLAMDVINQQDRNVGNLGYIEKEKELEAAQVDFDYSLEFDSTNSFYRNNEIYPASLLDRPVKDLHAIPDAMILRVLGDAYNNLWEAGIPLDYDKYKKLGQTVISKKNELKGTLENTTIFETLYDRAKYTPHFYTKQDNADLEQIVSSLTKIPLLCWSIINKEKDLINFFIEKGADINAKNENDWIGSPLHYTIHHKDIEIARLLLDNGADINATNGYTTPLHSAASSGSIDFINLFIDYGADLNARTNHGQTLLHFAANAHNIKIILFLIEQGLDVNAKDNAGTSPLHNSTMYENINAIHLLLEKGADIDAQDNSGKTPLYYAIQYSAYREAIHIIQFLLERGANIEPIEELLYLAIQNNRIDIFNLLLDHKVDLEMKNNSISKEPETMPILETCPVDAIEAYNSSQLI